MIIYFPYFAKSRAVAVALAKKTTTQFCAHRLPRYTAPAAYTIQMIDWRTRSRKWARLLFAPSLNIRRAAIFVRLLFNRQDMSPIPANMPWRPSTPSWHKSTNNNK